jgi:hypothetical protein
MEEPFLRGSDDDIFSQRVPRHHDQDPKRFWRAGLSRHFVIIALATGGYALQHCERWPRQWRSIWHVREKFSRLACGAIRGAIAFDRSRTAPVR